VVRVLIAGGGTGGHLFPGIAVAEALRRRDPAAGILFVGSERGIEARAVPASGFALEVLPVRPLRGAGMRDKVAALAVLAKAILRARTLVARFKPDVVIGLGGYASAPAVVAARLLQRPIVLLEQNARPGMTTRVLARLADRVCVSFRETARHFSAGKVVVTGNPVRWQDSSSPDRLRAPALACAGGTVTEPCGAAAITEPAAVPPRELTILVFGGSGGARRLNEAGPAMCAALADMPGLRVIHQAGGEAEAAVRAAYARIGAPAEVHAFITDMRSAYAAADIAICRSGATTVAELAALGKPAILVPYPHATDDHQRVNAESLARAGAARVVLDAEASGERLATEVRELWMGPAVLETMSRRVRQFARPDAAEQVLVTVEELVRQRARESLRG
jgi:UDP-N-acetylglucosamine--N-acetylmuramyl-(pentapeptide) pyrophosphoryl-undecaprenol N-acetylglucosamine transferase